MRLRHICRRQALAWSLPALVLCLGACDLNELLDVSAPTQIIASTLDDPAKAPDLINSMIGTFDCALGAYIVTSGEIGDVLDYQGSEVTRASYDARQLEDGLGHDGVYGLSPCNPTTTPGTGLGVYRPVQEARWFADLLVTSLEGWTDAEVPGSRSELIGTAALYAGFGYVMLGEGFCSAAIDEGPELTPAEVFALGVANFAKAIANGTSETVNAAYVGSARLKLNLGDTGGAAADAGMVPAGFAMSTTHSTASIYRYNTVSAQMWRHQNTFVAVAYRDLDWQGVLDPRTAVQLDPLPRANWSALKYLNLTDPIRFASWEEAQLIIAEVQGGQTAIDIFDQLHADAGLPPTGLLATDATGISDHLIQERTRELFLEGQRLYDMLRLNLPFVPAVGASYPGPGGGLYGTTTCMPLPPIEYENNDDVDTNRG